MDQAQRDEIKEVIKGYEEDGMDWGHAVMFVAVKFEGYLKEFEFGLERYATFCEKFLKHEAILQARRQKKLEGRKND